MKKDFNAALQNSSAFDGFSISQTEEEREAVAVTSFPPRPLSSKERTNEKKIRRISLYLEDGELLENLNAYCRVHGISKNKLILRMIKEYLTPERMDKVRMSLEALE